MNLYRAALLIALAVLLSYKMDGASISWLWVLSPIWGSIALAVALRLIARLLHFLAWLSMTPEERRLSEAADALRKMAEVMGREQR